MKEVHRLACLGILFMSISDSGVEVQNGAKSFFVVEFKKKQENESILLELKE